MASDSEEEFFDAPDEVPSARPGPQPEKEPKEKLDSADSVTQVSDVKEKDKRPARPTSDSEKKDTDTTDGPNQPTNRKPPPRPVSLPKIEKGDDIVNKNVSKSTNENRSSTESKPSPKGIYIVTSGTVENDNSTPPPVAPPRRKRKQKKEALAKTQQVKVETVEPAPVSVATKSLEREEDAATSKEVAAAMEQQSAQPFITVNADATDMNEVLQRGSSLDVVYNDDLAACKSPTKKVAHTEHTEQDSEPTNTGGEDEVKLRPVARTISQSGRPLSDIEILEQVVITNLDTGEKIPLSLAEEKIPQATNPLALHIMRITSEFSESESSLSTVQEDGHLSDSSLAPSVKLESKRKKLKKFFGKTVQKIKSVADEVKARQKDDSSSSDEEELQEDNYVKYKSHKAIRDRLAFDKLRLLQDLSGDHIGLLQTKFAGTSRAASQQVLASSQDNFLSSYEYDNLMNVGLAGLSNRDSLMKLLRSLYDLLNMPIFS